MAALMLKLLETSPPNKEEKWVVGRKSGNVYAYTTIVHTNRVNFTGYITTPTSKI